MRFKIPFILLLFASIVFFACSGKNDQASGEETKKVISFPVGNLDTNSVYFKEWRRKIHEHYQHLHLYAHFNGCVLVARQGNVIYKGSFGVKNVKDKQPLAINDIFQIASVSKTFTAMAILKLWDEGKLQLDAKLKTFFPDIPYPEVTVHDLLSHRSGLPNYLVSTEKEWPYNNPMKTNAQLLRYLVLRNPPIMALPGRRFSYNNTNYALLSLIIEKVSGMPYAKYMKEHIFEPVGMYNTYVFSAIDTVLPKQQLTTGYLRKNQPDQMTPADGITGDKNIYSTVEDMLIWERATTHPGLFSKKVLDIAIVPRSLEKPGVRNYGYGWRMMVKGNESQLVYHNGWWHGYTAAFYKNPSDETVIIVLSNIYNRNTYRVQAIWDILYGENGDMGFDQ